VSPRAFFLGPVFLGFLCISGLACILGMLSYISGLLCTLGGFDFHMYFGLWVLLGGLFRFSCGFWGVCWVGLLSGQIWVFVGGFFCMLGFECHGCSLWVSGFRVVLCGFVWIFPFVGWLWWFLYIPGVLRGALCFLIKSYYL
jgi:hypothetical protein